MHGSNVITSYENLRDTPIDLYGRPPTSANILIGYALKGKTLSNAAAVGNVGMVAQLIDLGANVNEGNGYPLRVAAERGYDDIVRKLLDADAKVHYYNDAALAGAIGNKNLAIFNLLIKFKADPHARNGGLIETAVVARSATIIDRLLELDVVPTRNALSLALGLGMVDVVKKFLTVVRADDAFMTDAASRGYYDIVVLLHTQGVRPTEEAMRRASLNGHSAVVRFFLTLGIPLVDDIQRVVAAGFTELVEILLDQSAETAPLSDFANLAFCRSCQNGHVETAKLLISRGARVDYHRNRALREASRFGRSDVVRLLLLNGATVHEDDDNALRSSSARGHLEVVQCLIQAGADATTRKHGAFRSAIKNRHDDVAKALILAGADVHVRGEMALLFAVERGYVKTVAMLVENGANVRVDNYTTFFTAARARNFEIVRLLLNAIASREEQRSVIVRFTIRLLQYLSSDDILRWRDMVKE